MAALLFNTPLYLVLTILQLILLVFWLVRVRFFWKKGILAEQLKVV